METGTPPDLIGFNAKIAALLNLDDEAKVDGLEQLSGGASRETWAFRADGQELILRRDPPSRRGPAGRMRREANSMLAAARSGLPVPEVIVVDDGTVTGTDAIVMRRVPGETIPRRILRDDRFAGARRTLTSQLARFLAGLHALNPSEVCGLPELDPLTEYEDRYRVLSDLSPTFELALLWLNANRPATVDKVVVHGDLRLGNVIVDPSGLAAVIDWELVHVGDPLEDLAWLCVKAWRFGAALPVAGVGTIEELIAAYEAASCRVIDRDAFDWWLVMCTLKWGIGCLEQATAHLSGGARSIELAAIGRRICEQEWDLLELLAPEEWNIARGAPADRACDVGGLHGRPTMAELVEAAGEYLSSEVMVATKGRMQFHTRVTVNALAIVCRELHLGAQQSARLHAGLSRLGVSSLYELAEAIRVGRFCGEESSDLLRVLAMTVRDRVAVANPRILEE